MTKDIQFFQKKGPFFLNKILQKINCKIKKDFYNCKIKGLNDLSKANKDEITFLNSIKYKDLSAKTSASACITSLNLTKYLPKKCIKLVVNDVLMATTQVSQMFYPNADMDYQDIHLKDSSKYKKKYKNVTFGKNVLIGKNVQIGKLSYIGPNSIIESNVKIGKNCNIGSFVIIKNSLLEDNVYIQDGSKIGVKGFGFRPNNNKNIRTPHIGKVILKEGVEIGSTCTIDRGSLGNTIIGKNTFLDNQVHIAHNVQVGQNCIIAGQVGVAGSSTLGNNVVIGGQAGISGHLKIGNNVSIGGGSGVIRNIPDNSKVMGYPAKPLKDFIKEWKK